MGTFLGIEVFHFDNVEAGEAIESAFGEIRRIEKILSRFDQDSLVFKINRSAHVQPEHIDKELFDIIQECFELSKMSRGAFDITAAPLVELWSEAEKINSLPSHKQISDLLPNIGYQNVILDAERNTIFFKTAHLKIDLGAVGKGYALYKAVKILNEGGVNRARLDFGGHLHYFDNLDLHTEYIGIRNPLSCEKIIVSIPLRNQSISTSANYERNFKVRDKIYGHIIDPITGYPVDNGILSASVISSNYLSADMLSTGIFVLGLDKGMQLIEGLDDTEAMIISSYKGRLKLNTSHGLRGAARVHSFC